MAPPAFRSGPPQRLALWVNKGLDWGPSKDVPLLQGRIRDLREREREINLVIVAQVMLIHRTLPCKRRPYACGSLIRRDHELSNILWA